MDNVKKIEEQKIQFITLKQNHQTGEKMRYSKKGLKNISDSITTVLTENEELIKENRRLKKEIEELKGENKRLKKEPNRGMSTEGHKRTTDLLNKLEEELFNDPI